MKTLVVGDPVLIREALRGSRWSRAMRPCLEASSYTASSYTKAMQIIAEHPDLEFILLDLDFPDRDGFSVLTEVLTELRERYPGTEVVVLSAQHYRGSLRALDLRALFIPKSGQRKPPQEPALREPPPTGPKNLSGGAAAEQPVITTPET